MVKLAPTPSKDTLLTLLNPVPVTTTEVPGAPLLGAMPVSDGGPWTVKTPADVTLPSELVTWTGPVEAPSGTCARRIELLETSSSYALALPKRTSTMPVKPVPSTSTSVPRPPLDGLKLRIVGSAPLC